VHDLELLRIRTCPDMSGHSLSELPRIPLPRTLVNKGRTFIYSGLQ
jgi:hypothetical protein